MSAEPSRPSLPTSQETLTSQEVVALLEIKPQTLYSYVARGLVRAVAQPGTRTKRYLREDVERLRIRSQAHAGQGAAAAAALHWGVPLITTGITEITPLGPNYRGVSALQLCERGLPAENTIELLWTGRWDNQAVQWSVPRLPRMFQVSIEQLRQRPGRQYSDWLATLFHLLNDALGERAEQKAGSMLPLARLALLLAADALQVLQPAQALSTRGGRPRMAQRVAHALGQAPHPTLLKHLDLALILGADHELPPSTFVARVVASTGGNLFSCLAAAASAFHGVLTGDDAKGLEAQLLQGRSTARIVRQIQQQQRQGRQLSGFNHPLYPHGDPRALHLIRTVSQGHARPELQQLLEVLHYCAQAWNWQPSFHAGLLAVQLAHGLPQGTASALNLLARLAGIAAHIQEQRLSGVLIRPRAQYQAG